MECLHDLLATEKPTRGITGKGNHEITLSDTLSPQNSGTKLSCIEINKILPILLKTKPAYYKGKSEEIDYHSYCFEYSFSSLNPYSEMVDERYDQNLSNFLNRSSDHCFQTHLCSNNFLMP